jgi:dephospho-CoA kinase
VLLVALTGGIGSGKTLAAQFFADLGAVVVDSDQLARQVIERGSAGFDEVVTRFGDEILSAGDIDRKKLSEIVFADPTARGDLEAITHPRIRQALAGIVATVPENRIVINQIPLLAETGGKARFDLVIAITSPDELRYQRLLERGMKPQEIKSRIAAQVSDAARVAIADYIITNDGNAGNLLRQVGHLWEEVLLPRLEEK